MSLRRQPSRCHKSIKRYEVELATIPETSLKLLHHIMGFSIPYSTRSDASGYPGIGSIICTLIVLYLCSYVTYQRFFHPLAKFPGPFLASLTDLWQVAEMLSLKQPYNLTDLHERYGQFVRYGPDKLSTTAEDAIPIVYQKGGRMFPKTEFYDAYGAYGATSPNIFGMRDEAVCI
jgi:hypothetical protein